MAQEGTEREHIPADLVHHFLLAICTRPGVGICFKDRGWYPRASETDDRIPQEDEGPKKGGRIHNKILANILKSLKVNEDARQQELALQIMVACPELVSGYVISLFRFLSLNSQQILDRSGFDFRTSTVLKMDHKYLVFRTCYLAPHPVLVALASQQHHISSHSTTPREYSRKYLPFGQHQKPFFQRPSISVAPRTTLHGSRTCKMSCQIRVCNARLPGYLKCSRGG